MPRHQRNELFTLNENVKDSELKYKLTLSQRCLKNVHFSIVVETLKTSVKRKIEHFFPGKVLK